MGHNTDWTGFSSSFTSRLRDAPRRSVLQIGTGGAGAATAYALMRLGVEDLVILDLDQQRARALADRYTPMFIGQRVRVAPADLDDEWSRFDGVVHATPTGMAAHPGLAFDPSRLSPQAWIAEIVYRPVETELVLAGRASGRHVIDGSMMAAGQAIDSLRILTGMEPDEDRVRADLLALLQAEEISAVAAAE